MATPAETTNRAPRLMSSASRTSEEIDLQADIGSDTFDHFEIVAPRAEWPDEFESVACELVGILSGVFRLDHIGSTAVPGLAAKDRLDIQLTTLNLDKARAWIAPLERAGFKHESILSSDRSPSDPWHRAKLFFHRSETRPHVNVHVRELDRGNWIYALLFRDYLRAAPAQASTYAEVKQRLAELVDGQRAPYSFIKEPACDLIFNAALHWAETTKWSARIYKQSNVHEFPRQY